MKLHAPALASLVLAGCAAGVPPRAIEPVPAPQAPASRPVPQPPEAAAMDGQVLQLRCDDGSVVRVRFEGDSALLEGLPSGPQELLRDAGGVTPINTVWSNRHLRAEFGIGDDGRHVLLHPIEPAGATLHCQAR